MLLGMNRGLLDACKQKPLPLLFVPFNKFALVFWSITDSIQGLLWPLYSKIIPGSSWRTGLYIVSGPELGQLHVR